MKKFWDKYSIIFWTFLIGSFIGFAHENLLMFIRGRYALRQGLLYEPLIPIYGLGALCFYFIYSSLSFKTKNKFLKAFLVFIVGFIAGGLIEYICSLLQENIFGTISWNYSRHKFNLNGRISFKYSCFWGLVGVLFYYYIMPLLSKIKKFSSIYYVKIITIILSIFLAFDCTITFFACLRHSERRDGVEAANSFDEFFDEYYPDEVINRVFNNARVRG